MLLFNIAVVTAMGCVSFLGFFMWMESAQVTYCVLMSGHWYTYCLTTLTCVFWPRSVKSK